MSFPPHEKAQEQKYISLGQIHIVTVHLSIPGTFLYLKAEVAQKFV